MGELPAEKNKPLTKFGEFELLKAGAILGLPAIHVMEEIFESRIWRAGSSVHRWVCDRPLRVWTVSIYDLYGVWNWREQVFSRKYPKNRYPVFADRRDPEYFQMVSAGSAAGHRDPHAAYRRFRLLSAIGHLLFRGNILRGTFLL